jgi:hypothetical protein
MCLRRAPEKYIAGAALVRAGLVPPILPSRFRKRTLACLIVRGLHSLSGYEETVPIVPAIN